MTMEYGIIGNHSTAALISEDGSIDWLCFPRFDSPSVFAKLLDTKIGGSFSIKPSGNFTVTQRYVGDTNVLETIFENADYTFSLYDFFPCYRENGELVRKQQIIRLLRPLRGQPSIKIQFDPKFNYAKGETVVRIENNTLEASQGKERLFLSSDSMLKDAIGDTFLLEELTFFALSYGKNESLTDDRSGEELLGKTLQYWQKLVGGIRTPRRYREPVVRSFLVLELLTYKDSGAVIAAPTTSLPEIVGKDRNWDYRYAWLRDASLAINAFARLRHYNEAKEFMKWILKTCTECGIDMQIIFDVEGGTDLEEKMLSHLSGYHGSIPVRIGNAAHKQNQLDGMGEVLQSAYLYFVHYNYSMHITEPQWNLFRNLVEHVVENWMKEDSGIWEFRDKKRHFTHSKVLGWVALDRGIQIARHLGKNDVIQRWSDKREQIRESIMRNSWNEQVKAFTQYYGSENLDASVLLMPYFGFLEVKDPKMKSTVEAIMDGLMVDGLVHRYISEDDFGRPENAFLPCTFWLINDLFLLGEEEDAKGLFERTLSFSNHLGLFSEHINPQNKALSGNFPLAYTHIAIINSAVLLGEGKIE